MQAPRSGNQVKNVLVGPLKYQQLADYFIALIRSGQLAPGMQLPTFAQMS